MIDSNAFVTLVGAGAIVNLNLGFIPEHVTVTNITDQTVMDQWYRGMAAGTSIKIDAAVAPRAAPNGMTILDSGGAQGITIAAAILTAGKTFVVHAVRQAYKPVTV